MKPTILMCAISALVVTGCVGGNQTPPESALSYSNAVALRPVHALTGTPPKIAYAGSPVDKSHSYINSRADEPGETWYRTGDIPEISSGGYTLKTLEYQRIIPVLEFDYAPGLPEDPELEAQVRRAFKLWTRYLSGIRGANSRLWFTVVEVGHADACGGADFLACVAPVGHPSNSYDVPVMEIPASQAALVANANSPIALLNTLAHEAGHALDYRHPGLGYYNPETGQNEYWHAPPYTRQLMSPGSGDSVTIGPQFADLLGVSHTFRYGEAYSPEYFGWWIDAPANSNLRAFGAGVSRSFDVADLPGETGDVYADSTSVTADTVTSDFVKVSSFVDGIPTHPDWLDDDRLPAHQELGGASWSGGLLAVDTVDYRPVSGEAHLSMSFTSTRLSARFDSFVEGPYWDEWAGPDSLSYVMDVNDDGVWHDTNGRVDARFFGSEANGEPDPAHTVAGHLDDEDVGIIGAYGATRD